LITSGDIFDLVTGLLTAIVSSSVFVLALFLGFCIIFGLPKLRQSFGRKSMTTKSLDERVGQERFAEYLPASAPRGVIDVLKTPELLEHARRTP
jgi:hypothetical protein